MKRHPRTLGASMLAALLVASLAACGGATGPTGPTGPGQGDPEPYWEMEVASPGSDTVDVTGTSVAFATPNVLVLGASEPAGWSVSFTITGDLEEGLPYFTGNGDLLNATVETPVGSDCVATSETNFALPSFVNFIPNEDDVPVGSSSIFVEGGCGTFSDEVAFTIGFGVQ